MYQIRIFRSDRASSLLDLTSHADAHAAAVGALDDTNVVMTRVLFAGRVMEEHVRAPEGGAMPTLDRLA